MLFRVMKPLILPLLAASRVLGAVVPCSRAEVTQTVPFTDHMVLPCGMAVPVWGTADTGETVREKFRADNW